MAAARHARDFCSRWLFSKGVYTNNAITDSAYNFNKILQTFWTGVKWSVRSDLGVRIRFSPETRSKFERVPRRSRSFLKYAISPNLDVIGAFSYLEHDKSSTSTTPSASVDAALSDETGLGSPFHTPTTAPAPDRKMPFPSGSHIAEKERAVAAAPRGRARYNELKVPFLASLKASLM